VSAATRPPRPGEVDGHDYFFLSRDEFEALRDAGGFLEWFEVYGDLKGTLRSQVVDALAAGHDVLVEVDVKGALAIKAAHPAAVLVFIRPPNRDELVRRLTERGTDSPEALDRRLAEADTEEALADHFDHIVVNDDVDRALTALTDILDGHKSVPDHHPESHGD